MDWYLDGTDAAAATALRREVMAYLRRHADPDADFDGAELAVSELIGNSVLHAGGQAWVSLSWSGRQPVITVHDLGPGFTPDFSLPDDPIAVRGRGMFLVSHLTDALEIEAKRGGGSRITATLPITRPPEADLDPPRHRRGALPDLDEASPQGGFHREPFLRALVVQLAQAVEDGYGPDVAEAAIAQVGTDVGGQMESEYRAAREVVDRLSPEQIADCLVRLKHAIDGDFFVIEITDDRIVLGNNKCPFGDVVQRAPALCRMTSSVFGGIAARNADDGAAAVVLEERIAVGDPGCRVTVFLGEPPDDATAGAHRYRRPVETD